MSASLDSLRAQKGQTAEYDMTDGFVASVKRDVCPRGGAAADSYNYDYVTAEQAWKRRPGMAKFFDANPDIGLLSAKWPVTARVRHLFEMRSPSFVTQNPDFAALFTKEAMSAVKIDDGRMGTLGLWHDDGTNFYEFAEDAEAAAYYPPTAIAGRPYFMGVPLWYRSGDGGITRGTTAFQRRLMLPGARQVAQIGEWLHIPNYDGTHVRWNRKFCNLQWAGTTDGNLNRFLPAGPLPGMWPPTATFAGATTDANPKWKSDQATVSSSKRFFVSVAYRFEDGSVWMPFIPRPKDPASAVIPNGYGLVTVPASGVGNIGWDTLTLTNIPIMPFGCVAKLILFSEFVDVTCTVADPSGANDQRMPPLYRDNALNLRIVAEIRDNTTTSFVVQSSDPNAYFWDTDGVFIHADHMMAPSARYLAGGDLRVGALHGVTSPCAIVICPVGDAANFDKNVSDEPVTSATFTNTNFFMRITETVGGAKDLVLYTKQAIGGVAIGTTTYNLSTTYRTLQALVDAINTSVAAGADGRQWKAQLAPGVDPNASTDDLLAHRLIAPGVVSHTNNSPTITVGDLANEWSRLAVGAWVEAPAAIAGRYIKSKDTRTLVAGLPVEGTCTLDGNATATGGPVQLIVYLDSGDAGLSALAEPGIQRVFGPMTPGFLYFKSTYFDRQLAADKQALWTTQGGPNLPRAAGNSWTTRVSGKHRPSAGAGIGVGLVPVQDGFVCGYADHVWKLVNTTNTNDTRDENYRLEPLDLEDGVKSWGGMVKGPNCAIWCGRVGVYAGDLVRKFMISKAIWNASERRGPVRFEIESSALATSRDDDTAYLKLEVVRDRLNVFYRADEAATYPNRRMVYDFSGAVEAQGALQMVDAGDNPFQWSTQFLQSLSALALIRRGDGERVVGILDTNAGTIGDGRAEYVDTGNTDNGVAIVARLYLRTDDLGDRRKKKSAQEFVLRYRAAVGQLLLRVSRDYGRLSELTHTVPQTGPSEIRTKRIPLKMQLRAPADFVEVVIEDTGQPVAASEVHFGALEYLTLPSY